MFLSILASLVVVVMFALPAMAASMVTVRATRQYNETDPNCTAYIGVVRDWMNDELVVLGNTEDRLLRTKEAQQQEEITAKEPIVKYTVVKSIVNTTTTDEEDDCEDICYQFPHSGYCWTFTYGRCGIRPNRRLGERSLVTDEDHEQCLARQHLLLDGFITAAMNLTMTQECREFFLSPWETKCFFGGH